LENSKTVSLKTELVRHIGGTFLLKVFGLMLNLASGIILARAMGATGYGIYSFPIAVVTLLSIPSTAGLPQLIVRSISQYYANKEYGLMRGLLIRANQFVFLLSILCATGAALIYFLFGGNNIHTPAGITFAIAMGLLPIISFKNVRLAVLRGLRKVLLGQIPDILVRPILFLVSVGLMLTVGGRTLSPHLAMTLQLFAAGFAFILGIVLLIIYQPIQVKQSKPVYNTSLWFHRALPFLFLGVVQIINKQTDIVMLGILRPASDVGVYRAVVHGSMLVTFVLTSVNTAMAPQISRLWTLGENKRLQKMVTITARAVAYATFLSAGVLIIGGRFFLTLFFGEEFGTGVPALRILCIGQMVNGFAGSVGNILNMTGYERKSLLAMGIAAFINVLLNILLIPPFGIIGASIATAVSLSIWNIFLVIWVNKFTGIHSTALGFI